MKIGRASVSERGSSARNGLVTGEMNPSNMWSLRNHPPLWSPRTFSNASPNFPDSDFPRFGSDGAFSVFRSDRLARNSFTGSTGGGLYAVRATAASTIVAGTGVAGPAGAGAPNPAAGLGAP